MASTTLAIASLTILSLLSLSTSSQLTSTLTTTHEAFLHCFKYHTQFPKSTSQLLYTLNTTSYNTIFRSSIQNLRFLSPSTTKPTLIITPTTESHVQASIICGKTHGLRIRVRSGGHDYEGLSYVATDSADPFIVIDLINLRSITVDPTDSTAWIGAGATVGEVYYNIAAKNGTSGFPAGICPTIGVGGHFSGGGIGALLRKYGTAADNTVDALLVDANGNLLDRQSMGEDLFWAIRGGGAANFGIVLSYKIKLVYVPPVVTIFIINKTLRQGATRLVERWQHVAPKLDNNIFIRILVMAVNDNGNRTIRAAFQCLFLGGARELLSLMEENFPELGVEDKDCKEMSWIESVLDFAGYSKESSTILLDRKPQYNSSFKAKSDFVKEPISEEGWEGIWKFLLEGEGEPLVMIMDPWGGRMDEIEEGEIAFPHRKGNLYNIQYFMRWLEEEEEVSERHLDWMRRLYIYMGSYVSEYPRAAYLNYKDIDLGRNQEATTSYYEASVWGRKYFLNNFERLAFVKGRVDPENYFWNEQSIPTLWKY